MALLTNGHEFERALGDGKGQESLVSALCPRGHKESDMTEQLNNNKVKLSPVKIKHIKIVPNFLPFRSP